MSEIVIMEKPEWITYEDIHKLLYRAHESNREKGFHVKTAVMTGNEIKEHLGETGRCFVALDGEKLVGTTSYRILERNYWCAQGKIVDRVLAGVLPEYKGKHISSMLFQRVEEEARREGYLYIESRTAEENDIVQKINLKDGYQYIDFLATKADHYTVVMLKWLNGCPISDKRMRRHYELVRFKVKVRYKRGRVKRFGI